MTTPNTHGVHTDAERITFVVDPRRSWLNCAEIKIGKSERGYFVSISVQLTSCGLSDPCMDSPPHFETRDGALSHGLSLIEEYIDNKCSEERGEYPVAPHAEKLRRVIAASLCQVQQAELFCEVPS